MNGILCGESFSYRPCDHESQFHSIATLYEWRKMNGSKERGVILISLLLPFFRINLT